MKVSMVLLLLFWAVFTLFVYFFYTQHNKVNKVKELVKRKKVILLWNTFFGDKEWGVGFGSESFTRLECKVSNCEVTGDRNRTADAVLFHDHQLEKQPPQLPHRPYHQRWVFFTQESPVRWNHDHANWNGLFNWTMTYRTESDVQCFYGSVHLNETKERRHAEKNWTALVQQRRPVAWMVSNCQSNSNREEYVRRLQKWIDVDIYGQCGNLTCLKTGGKQECLDMVNNKYNFYLAFENAICKDYITEKFFKILPLDVIPVVRGGASYEQHCPHKWFVNTEDFASPEQLAMHLKSLIAQPEKYAEFMKDKQNYDSKTTYLRHHTSWCELCAKLNDPEEQTKVYKELDKWWNRSDCHFAKDL